MRLGLRALLLYLQEGEHASAVSYIHVYIHTDKLLKGSRSRTRTH